MHYVADTCGNSISCICIYVNTRNGAAFSIDEFLAYYLYCTCCSVLRFVAVSSVAV